MFLSCLVSFACINQVRPFVSALSNEDGSDKFDLSILPNDATADTGHAQLSLLFSYALLLANIYGFFIVCYDHDDLMTLFRAVVCRGLLHLFLFICAGDISSDFILFHKCHALVLLCVAAVCYVKSDRREHDIWKLFKKGNYVSKCVALICVCLCVLSCLSIFKPEAVQEFLTGGPNAEESHQSMLKLLGVAWCYLSVFGLCLWRYNGDDRSTMDRLASCFLLFGMLHAILFVNSILFWFCIVFGCVYVYCAMNKNH